jgi:hypothetical protein
MNREVTDRKVCTAKSDVDSMEAGGLPLRAVGTRLFRSVPPRSAGVAAGSGAVCRPLLYAVGVFSLDRDRGEITNGFDSAS